MRAVPSTPLDRLVRAAASIVTPEGLWALFVGYLLVLSVFFAWRQSAELQPFTYGDWVIHYLGGFVRRGLVGEVIVRAGGPENAPLAVFLVKLTLYAALFLASFRLFRPLVGDRLVFVCVLAPMGLAFSVVDSWGGGRKELILLAVMAVQAAVLAARHAGPQGAGDARSPVGSAILFLGLGFVGLSHEALLFFCGFPLLVHYLDRRSRGDQRASSTVFAMIAVLGGLLLLQVVFPGRPEQATRLCAALGASAPVNCLGFSAISWLGNSFGRAVTDVITAVGGGALWLYGAAAILSAVPIWLLIRTSDMRPSAPISRQTFLFALLAANLATLPPYLVGTDWGRWEYIALCGNLFVLGYCFRTGLLVRAARSEKHEEAGQANGLAALVKGMMPFVIFAYIFMWSVPHSAARFEKGHIGVLERFAKLVSDRIEARSGGQGRGAEPPR